MKDGLCAKECPKRWKDDANPNVNGYPEYRRRATEPLRTVKKTALSTPAMSSPTARTCWKHSIAM
eukprot:8388317-Pyramimonas_sp.AAC.1